jgi:Integrase core domain
MAVRQRSKHELVAALQGRYRRADRAGKARLLDEFCAATGYHRKHAIRLLRDGPPPQRSGHGGRARVYSAVVIGALRVCAEASGWLCGKRLAPFLAELVPALEAEGALRMEPLVRSQLLAMSAATIDRRLQPFRLQLARGFGATKPGSLIKSQVPVRTWTPWDEQRIGFLEIDLVAHCGINNRGHYLFTLVATDVASGWTECMGVPSKRQDDVFTALEFSRGRLPFVLLGLDSDNGGEFLNSHLVDYCSQHRLTFTRSRPYWKNDQAHVEQKNWSIVRKLIGYDRYDSAEALAQLNRVYEVLRLWTNHWQPVMKLIGKERVGAKLRKRYDVARTPYQRLRENRDLSLPRRQRLEAEHARLAPLALKRRLDSAVMQLERHRSRPAFTEAAAAAM